MHCVTRICACVCPTSSELPQERVPGPADESVLELAVWGLWSPATAGESP